MRRAIHWKKTLIRENTHTIYFIVLEVLLLSMKLKRSIISRIEVLRKLQSVFDAPFLLGRAAAVLLAGVAALGTRVLPDRDAGQRVRDGVVPDLGVVRSGDVNADARALDDVGGDHVLGGDLVEDRHRHVDEVVADHLGVYDPLVEPDPGPLVILVGVDRKSTV